MGRSSSAQFSELVEALPGVEIIDRPWGNAYDCPLVVEAIEATGRKKLIFAGVSLEVCAAFPAMTAVARGLDAYVGPSTSAEPSARPSARPDCCA